MTVGRGGLSPSTWQPPHDPRLFAAAGDAGGRRWLERLPALTTRYCSRWSLAASGPPLCGFHAVVLPAHRDGEAVALKLTWPTAHAAAEATALRAWDGRGCVRLIECDARSGALLLEGLQPGRTLRNVPVMEAGRLAGALLHELTIAAPAGFPSLTTSSTTMAADLAVTTAEALGLPGATWSRVLRAAEMLAATAEDRWLVHADLHYGNVLAGSRRPWLAIDPKPMAGEAEYAVPELMWTRADELGSGSAIRRLLDTIASSAGLSSSRAREWVITRSADYLRWGIDHGLTDDPPRCRRVIDALL